MSGIDLYGLRSRWPSILHRRNAPTVVKDKSRSTILDAPLGQQTARRADPSRVADLLSQLIQSIEGRPLSDFVPMAQAIPLLIGLTPSNLQSFDEFLGAFIGTVLENGRTVEPGSVTSPSDSISANRRALAAGALGVGRSADVEPGRPASVRRFDELMMLFSEGRTLAAILADADDGLPPGVAEVVGAMLTAIKNNLKSGDPAAARQAGADAGALIAAVHAAFFTEATAQKALRTRGGRVVRDHTAGFNGPVLVRKAARTSRAVVVGVELDVENFTVDPRTGEAVRKRKRKLKPCQK